MAALNQREECMVLVMGVTGAGKSHFVNKLKENAAKEGSGLRSETQHCQITYSDVGEDMSLAIVDTPGFDDTVRSDVEVLHQITRFLSTQHQLGIRLKGIIYLQSINENRMRGSSVKYFRMFENICGEKAFSNVILLTTMWDLVPAARARQRHQQIREEFWNTLEDRGSLIASYDGSPAMAEGLVLQLLAKEDVVLQVQKELDDRDYLLEQTSVGRLVVPSVEEKLNGTRQELMAIDERISNAISAGRREERKAYEEKKRKTLRKLDKESLEREELKTNIHSEVVGSIGKEKKKSKWRSSFEVLAATAGLTITIFVNLLPFLGVY